MILESVLSAEIIITLFCDSISFNKIIIICLKNENEIKFVIFKIKKNLRNYLKFLIGSSQFPCWIIAMRLSIVCITSSGSFGSLVGRPIACFITSLSRRPPKIIKINSIKDLNLKINFPYFQAQPHYFQLYNSLS